MSVWNSDNITDVAESVGIGALNKEVVEHLARDVEFRISQVIEEALKFMRHGKRTTLSTQDISQALRLLDVEPLYGYDSTRPLRFGEASIGPGQPLFYIEDEEVDFEKLINAPLPKVPREMSLTGEISCAFIDIWNRRADRTHRALACCRRCSAFHTSEPYLGGSKTPRAITQRSRCQPKSCCCKRQRQCRSQATRQAHIIKRAATIL